MNTPIIKRYQRDEARRMQAAELFEQDLSNAEIARRLKVSRQAVSGWYQTWKEQGKAGPFRIPFGEKNFGRRLRPEERLANLLFGRSYDVT